MERFAIRFTGMVAEADIRGMAPQAVFFEWLDEVHDSNPEKARMVKEGLSQDTLREYREWRYSPGTSGAADRHEEQVDPTAAMDVPDTLAQAVAALCQGKDIRSHQLLASIDVMAILRARVSERCRIWGPGGIARSVPRPPKRPRQTVPHARKLETFRRDRFVCRYQHCQRRTVALPVLKALSRAFPDLLPYRNWEMLDQDRQILYWVYVARLEHQAGVPAEGASDASDLVTACRACRNLRSWLPAAALGWQISEPATTRWNGLESFIPALREAGLITAKNL